MRVVGMSVRAAVSWLRVVLVAAMALAMLVPFLPGQYVALLRADVHEEAVETAEELLDEVEQPEARGAVWRVRARSWLESWGDAWDTDGDSYEQQSMRTVQFVGPLRGFVRLDGASGKPALLATDDGGATWSLAHRDHQIRVGPEFFDESVGVAVTFDPDTRVVGVRMTSDGGRTWSSVAHATGGVNDFAFTTTGFSLREHGGVVGVGSGGRVFRSVDGGAIWTDKEARDNFSTQLNAVDFIPAGVAGDGVGIAVGGSGTILSSTDGGATWTPRDSVSVHVVGDDDDSGEAQEISLAQLGVDLVDVAVVRDEGHPEGRTLAVAVGTGGAIVSSEWFDGEPPAQEWRLHLLGREMNLRSVALADIDDDEGGLVAYVAGGRLRDTSLGRSGVPVVLEMQGGDPSHWIPGPVDPRATAYFPRANSVEPHLALNAVAIVPEASGAAFAIGERVMLERTMLDRDDPAVFADSFADPEGDDWWRCVPTGGTTTVAFAPVIGNAELTADDVLRESAKENLDDEQVCDDRGESLIGVLVENFKGDPRLRAERCRLDQDSESRVQAPCVATWQPFAGPTAEGEPLPSRVGANASVFLDEDMAGQGRRLVVVSLGKVYLFDPDAPAGRKDAEGRPVRGVQRGVRGFGEGMTPGRQGQTQDPLEWGETSAFGADTGVVDLRAAPRGIPTDKTFGSAPGTVAYDDELHRLYLMSTGDRVGSDPVIVALSLTSEFAPTATRVPALEVSDRPTNHSLARVVFDSTYGMLYALTVTDYRNAEFPLTAADATEVTLHAFFAREFSGAGNSNAPSTGALTRVWSLSLENRGCRTTQSLGFRFFGVSRDGETLSFPCLGHAGPQTGTPNFEPNQVATVKLRLREGKEHPRDLSTAPAAGDVTVFMEPIGGKVIAERIPVALGVEAREVLAWNQQAQGATLWDFGARGWIGAVPRRNIGGVAGEAMDAGHARRGRLYFTCEECVDFGADVTGDGESDNESALLVVDTLNVPAQVPAGVTDEVRIPAGSGHAKVVLPPRGREQPQVVLLGSGGVLHIIEDRTAPDGERVSPDPDARTFPDVAEEEAADVQRIGRTSAYGARVWWAGAGTATALMCEQGIESPGGIIGSTGCGKPSVLSYNWMTDPDSRLLTLIRFGPHTSVIPGLPGGGARELRLGEVQNAELENNESGQLSSAKATAFFYDGGPADDSPGTTGDDVHRRRGRDLHRHLDAELRQLCETYPSGAPGSAQFREECHDPHAEFMDAKSEEFDPHFEEFEVRFDELVDRAMREVDGERRIRGGCDDPATDEAEDCFEEFDEHDPRCRRDADGRPDCSERSSVQERAQLFQASNCLEPGGRDVRFAGSGTECVVDEFGRTAAHGELNGLALVRGGASGGPQAVEGLSIGAAGSETEIVRDPERGVVVETTAWATDIEVRVPGQGSLRIGQVRSLAQAQAFGRPGTAESEHEVWFQDVVITGGPGGEQRFACGRSERDPLAADPPDVPQPPDSSLPPQFADESDGDSAVVDECDPHVVANVISAAFAGRVQATTSARDLDPKIAGSPGGAQAIVRRDPRDVLSDEVINEIRRQFEIPALQLTIFNDGLRANRVKVDLAAVRAETLYAIGQPRPEVAVPVSTGSIEVMLSDVAGNPLSGGEFTVSAGGGGGVQVSGGGVTVGDCITGPAGTCRFDGLDAGTYLVEQLTAPPGFLPDPDPRSVFVSKGGLGSVAFVNGPDAAGVVVELLDPSGVHLPGGEFALVPDRNGDGTVGLSDAVAASCVTGQDGVCRFDRVSLGAWVLHQAGAPAGYRRAGDVAFTLTRPGQVAHIRVVNGPAVAGATVRIVEIIEGSPISQREGSDAGVDPWWAFIPKGLGSILLRGWVQALLFALTGVMFGAPAYLAHRRRELAMAKGRR